MSLMSLDEKTQFQLIPRKTYGEQSNLDSLGLVSFIVGLDKILKKLLMLQFP